MQNCSIVLDAGSVHDGSSNSRKSVLRQQSYKLAQQQTVLPPLPWQFNQQNSCPAMDPRLFGSIVEEESQLHSHKEEDEDEQSVGELEVEARENSLRTSAWQTLPVTMADCKLNPNTSLGRLSPLVPLETFQSSVSSTPSMHPFEWDQQNLHLPQSSILQTLQERMDTSGS